jgi:catechol 2,3-dioxygenase-like lactoylglutathione lyase family enzyme
MSLEAVRQPKGYDMKLHEVGFFAKDPDASTRFYHETLGLKLDHDEDGLSVFDSGWPGLEIGACSGYPDRVHISFIVEDVDIIADDLRSKGIRFAGPEEIHLGKRAIMLKDPDGLRVMIQSPTEESPDWVKKMVE